MFQSTHSRGVRLLDGGLQKWKDVFQSTHSRGVRPFSVFINWYFYCFNPRTHEECDGSTLDDPGNHVRFQSTHSRGVRHLHTLPARLLLCFNPRTHEECDVQWLRKCNCQAHVSIHALTRSATFCYLFVYRGSNVSIHALTRSATQSSIERQGYENSLNPRTNEECDQVRPEGIFPGICFNPRTHEECDKSLQRGKLTKDVSIHALTRSATTSDIFSFTSDLFQSTHSRGVRLDDMPLPKTVFLCFNPRTHEECDSCSPSPAHGTTGFNPRTHEECDGTATTEPQKTGVSIHALTRSATAYIFSFLFSDI